MSADSNSGRTWSFVKQEEGWILLGAPDFMVPNDDPWVMAHDVVHHRDTDQGSFADELASIGAESYFDAAAGRLTEQKVATVLHSIASMCWESMGLESLRLTPSVQEVSTGLPSDVETILRSAWRAGIDETLDYWILHQDRDAAFMSQESYALIGLQTMGEGWAQAAQRWPDPREGERLFTTIETALRKHDALDTQVDVIRNTDGVILVETKDHDRSLKLSHEEERKMLSEIAAEWAPTSRSPSIR